MVSHLFSTALGGSVKRLWSMKRVLRVKRWESKDTAINVQTKNESRRGPGGIQEENVKGDEGQMEDDEITDDGREER